jgi:hypothetical protein
MASTGSCREEVRRQLAKAVRGDGQNDDVGVTDDLGGRDGTGAGREHVDGQRDVTGRPRSGHGDVVAGRDRGTCERGAELARADDAETQITALAPRHGSLGGARAVGVDHRDVLTPDSAATGSSAGAASRARTRGMTSLP